MQIACDKKGPKSQFTNLTLEFYPLADSLKYFLLHNSTHSKWVNTEPFIWESYEKIRHLPEQ